MVNLRIRRPEPPARRGYPDWPLMSDVERRFLDRLPLWFQGEGESMIEGTWTPRVDIIEKDDSWQFIAELPDIKPEDIKVTIEEGVLSIRGERKLEHEVTEGSYTRFERQYGTFERRFSLPTGIDAENVKADYKAGVLNLTIPKKEEAKPKSINIDVK